MVIFGTGLCLGIMFSGYQLSKNVFKDYIGFVLAQSIVFTSVLVPNVIEGLPNSVIYVLYFFQTFGVGMCCNL